MAYYRSLQRSLTCLSLAVSISFGSGLLQQALANPGDVNSTNNGQHVSSGTYYNTPGDKTTFINTAGTGIVISTGTTITAREVSNAANPGGSLTGNGGWINIYAPHQVVRIDGNIDASALLNNGAYLGHGGRVTVTAPYLFQNGQIYVNGYHGGQVQFNVGSLTLGSHASIMAQGFGGHGGTVQLGNQHSHGVFDLQQGSIVDTSGKVIGQYDANLITIQGGLINLEGVLIANGVSAVKPSGNGSDGGTVLLLARGNTTPLDHSMLSNASFMQGVQSSLVARDNSLRVNNYDGWIRLGSQAGIQTNGGNGMAGTSDDGGNGGDGGYISLTAKCGIENNGTIQNNGGQGGDAPTTYGTLSRVFDSGETAHLEEDANGKDGGNGGDGGNIDFQYRTAFLNKGSIQSIGGNGGHGGDAIAINPLASASWAFGADGGNGSDGGNIDFTGGSAPLLVGQLNQSGGVGGLAGHGYSQTPGNAFSGDPGTHGDSGIYDYTRASFCSGGCENAPGGGPISPPGDPNGSSFNGLLNPNLNGLFQHIRPIFIDPVNHQPPPLLFALGQTKMFLAKTYSSVTQEILSLAFREYSRLLTNGRPRQDAAQDVKHMLLKAGVDKSVAQALLERIHDGRLQAGPVVVQMLSEIAEVYSTDMLSQPLSLE